MPETYKTYFRTSRWLSAAHIAALVFLIAVSFAPSLGNDFINWDDESHILKNPLIASLSWGHALKIFLTTVNLTYIPLTMLSYAVENALFGLSPFVVHLDNIICHALVTVLIYSLSRQLRFSPAASFVGAALFGVHPMHVESVVWATERKDVLYSVFYVLALSRYLVYCQAQKTSAYVQALVLGLLSMLAKPMALSLPLALLALDWLQGRPFQKKIFLEKIPFVLVVVPLALVTYMSFARSYATSGVEAIMIWVWCLTFYVQKFLFPAVLVPVYDLPKPLSITHGPYFMSLLTLIISAGVIVKFRKDRLIPFAFLFYFVSIFFLLRFDHQADINLVSDRFMYLPSLGFCVLFGVLGLRVWNSEKFPRAWVLPSAGILMSAVFGFLIFRTMTQCRVWQNSFTFWDYVILHNPQNPFLPLAYYNRGNAFVDQKRYSEALEDYQKALSISPTYQKAIQNRGLVFSRMGRWQEALDDLNAYLKSDDTDARAFNNRGDVYSQLGENEKALEDFQKAISLDPDYSDAYINRGNTKLNMREIPAAFDDFNKAVKLDPQNDSAFYNRGNANKMTGHLTEAIQDYRQAITLNPRHVMAHNNLGNVFGMLGDLDLALRHIDQAIALDPGYYQAYNNRAVARMVRQEFPQALKDLRKAVELNPEFAEGYANIGSLFLQSESLDLALENFSRAISLGMTSPQIYFFRSQTYAKQGHLPNAMDDALKAKELGARDLDVYIAKLEKMVKAHEAQSLQSKELP